MIKRFISMILAVLILAGLLTVAVFADYENTYKNTGVYADDLVGVALTQTGYKTENSFRYGDTANCSLSFLDWCADEAKIPDEVIPEKDTVTALYDFYKTNDLVNNASSHKPQPGDIMFLGTGTAISECAIVISADDEYVFAVICESDKSVKKKMYTIGISKIISYATPDYGFVAEYISGKYMTTASFLNMRSAPSITGEIIEKIPIGTLVDITEFSDDWGFTEYNGVKGWISMDYTFIYDDSHSDSSKYGVIWNVIDVSKWQGDINWDKIAESDIDAVIMRIGLRGSVTREVLIDERFLEYYAEAKARGLHIGCYFYSTATNDQEAVEEAQFIIDTINKHKLTFDMPVYMDMEDPVTQRCGKATIFSMTYAFLQKMDEVNIYSGVYCSTSWAEDYYNQALFSKHSLWIADWREKCGYEGNYGMWQYTEKGSVSGVESRYTDLNICYINYPQLIADKGYNSPKKPVTETPTEPVSEITTIPEVMSEEVASEIEDVSEDYSEVASEDTSETEIIPGDVNFDGRITASDARLALRIAATLHKGSEYEKIAADINSDTRITASDARLILRISANLR